MEHEKCLEIIFHSDAQIEPTLFSLLHSLWDCPLLKPIDGLLKKGHNQSFLGDGTIYEAITINQIYHSLAVLQGHSSQMAKSIKPSLSNSCETYF